MALVLLILNRVQIKIKKISARHSLSKGKSAVPWLQYVFILSACLTKYKKNRQNSLTLIKCIEKKLSERRSHTQKRRNLPPEPQAGGPEKNQKAKAGTTLLSFRPLL